MSVSMNKVLSELKPGGPVCLRSPVAALTLPRQRWVVVVGATWPTDLSVFSKAVRLNGSAPPGCGGGGRGKDTWGDSTPPTPLLLCKVRSTCTTSSTWGACLISPAVSAFLSVLCLVAPCSGGDLQPPGLSDVQNP